MRDKLGNRRLNEISRQQVQLLHTSVLDKGLAHATVAGVNYLGRRVASRRNVTRRLVVVPASSLAFQWSKAVGMWAKAAAVGNAAAQRRVVHGRSRCAAGASSTCPWPAGREAPGPAFGVDVFVPLFQTSIGISKGLRKQPRTISFARSARQALTRRCSVRSCALLA